VTLQDPDQNDGDRDDGDGPLHRPVGQVSPVLRDRPLRWRIPAVAGVAVLAVTLLLAGRGSPPAVPPPLSGDASAVVAPAAAAAAAVPGEEPGVQRWLKAREKLQIELVNSAVAVTKLDPAAGRPRDNSCARLAAVTAALNAFAGAPSAQLDQLTRAGLAKFTDGAKACLAGDVPGAITTVKAGLAERAAALDALDDVLEGA